MTKNGYFGRFGGRFVPETLMAALEQLEACYMAVKDDPGFWAELNDLLQNYAGRPTPLYYAARLSRELGIEVYLKREDLLHTGAHKINNALGQALLACRMGKKRIIAETGAGQHGVATATVAALLGLECTIYMGEEDVVRQASNVARMQLLGAEVVPVRTGSRTLKDAMNEAMRDWVTNVISTYYLVGSVAGPHPYPTLVRDLQRVIGVEAREQILRAAGRLPHAVVACVGGGSNAIGIFSAFLADPVQLVGVEGAGLGLNSGQHAASLSCGAPGILHGALTYVLQDDDGQILLAHSIAAGLDYPGVGPEHSYLKESGRVTYTAATDEEALAAFHLLARREGIIPALESAHALAAVCRMAPAMPRGAVVIVNLSGRGDKDVPVVMRKKGVAAAGRLGREHERWKQGGW